MKVAAPILALCLAWMLAIPAHCADRELTDDSDPNVPPGVELRSWAIEGRSFPIEGRSYQIEGRSYPIEGLGTGIEGRGTLVEGAAKEIEAAGVKISENENEITLELSSDVLFDFDKSNIKPEAAEALRKVAELLKQYPNQSISLSGHTDSKGSDSYNDKLSLRRAQSVRDHLVKRGGVTNRNLTSYGYGKKKPVVPNQKPDGSDDPDGRQRNRRVEIKISK